MPEAGSGALLLLVEDERALRKVMEMLLEDHGYRVVTATNGREGLQRLAEVRPSLIITDFMMPEMDGIEMIREIRRTDEFSGIPILLMSAVQPSELGNGELADRFLGKGSDIGRLLDTIAAMLEPAG